MDSDTPKLAPQAGRLTERQRDAITLELEDRQKDLVEDLWHLSRGLINRVRVPDAVLDQPELLAAPWSGQFADRFHALMDDLRRTTAALSSLRRDRYGLCVACGEPISPALLMAEMLRETCPACASAGGRSGEL